MRFAKKERVDVKKFIDDMKANRTNRSFTSLERNRHTSEDTYQNQQIASKCSFNSNEKYPPNNIPSQKIKYNFDHQSANYQPTYIPYVNEFGMTQQSQMYPSPPFQQGYMNYSQTFNSPHPFINYQDSSFIEHGFGEMNNYSQIKGVGSKISVTNDNERLNALPIKNYPQASLKNQNTQSAPFINNNPPKNQEATANNVEVTVEQKKAGKGGKKEGKRRQKKKNLPLKESQDLQVGKESYQDESKQKRLIQEDNFKAIMGSFNIKIDDSAAKYLSSSVLQRLSTFEDQISKLSKQPQLGHNNFLGRLKQFQSSIMRKLDK